MRTYICTNSMMLFLLMFAAVANGETKYPTYVRLGLPEIDNDLFPASFDKSPKEFAEGKLDLRTTVYMRHSGYREKADDPRDDSTRWRVSPHHPLVDFLTYTPNQLIRGFRMSEKLPGDLDDKAVTTIVISCNLKPIADYLERFPSCRTLSFTHGALDGHRSRYRFTPTETIESRDYFHSENERAAAIRIALQHPHAKRLISISLPPSPVTNDLMMLDVKNLKGLRAISLFCSDVSDLGLEFISTSPELRVLNLDGCRITDDGVKELAKVKNLQSLSLNGCRMVTDASLKAFHKHSKLMEIRAAGTQITDAAVRELHRATPNFHYAWLDDRNLPHDSKETPRFFDFTGKDKMK